jgi:secreted trypsin-like serine protease
MNRQVALSAVLLAAACGRSATPPAPSGTPPPAKLEAIRAVPAATPPAATPPGEMATPKNAAMVIRVPPRNNGRIRAGSTVLFKNIQRAEKPNLVVIGGGLAGPGDWPWAVALIGDLNGDGNGRLFCGGALVADQWVLTAAHCGVDAADWAFIDEIDLAHPATSPVGIDHVCTYDQFNHETYDFDIALVQLRQPVQSTLSPLTDGNPNWEQPNVPAAVLGWGSVTQSINPANQLYLATIPIVSNADCESVLSAQSSDPNDQKKITQTELCAGSQGAFGACMGDSGGPLLVSKGTPGSWVQVGVVSWGSDCSKTPNYGVYTRVSAVRDWIDATLRGDTQHCRVANP